MKVKHYSERYAKYVAKQINCKVELFLDFTNNDKPLMTKQGKPILMFQNNSGKCVGLSDVARWLFKHNIKVDDTDFQIGFQEKSQKWIGWSHRASQGFGIGDMLYSEQSHQKLYEQDELLGENTPFVKIGFKQIETLEEAKQAALNFAHSVS